MFNYSSDNLTSKEIRIEIGKRLHSERMRAKISLDKLAELTGYSKPTVQRWEKGWKYGTGENVIPTLDQIIELCAIYKCSPGYLLCEYPTHTRQAFDATLELGLTEESVNRLQMLHLHQVDNHHSVDINIFMCFLNYLICHSDYLSQLLKDRYDISCRDFVTVDFPDIEILKEALSTPHIQRLLYQSRTFANDVKHLNNINQQLLEAFKEYYEAIPDSAKYFKLSSEKWADYAMLHINSVYPISQRQSDFYISDTFLEIVNLSVLPA